MKHIVMIPLAAYGHIIPMLQLARKLSPFYRITCVVPQYLVHDIRTRDILTETDQLTLHALQDGYQQDLLYEKTAPQNIRKFFDSYAPKLEDFCSSLTKAENGNIASLLAVDTIIVDQLFSELSVVFKDKQIPFYHFNTSALGGLHLKGLLIDEHCPIWMEEEGIFPVWDKPENGLQPLPIMAKILFLEMKKYFPLTEGLIVNSYREMEMETLEKLKAFPVMDGKKVFMIGPLIPDADGSNARKTCDQDRILEWMSTKEKSSVIYISFGTVATPSPEQVAEIGKALLLTKKPFIWSLSTNRHEYLPDEIKSRVKSQFDSSDFLIMTWAPQVQILTHPSTGLFVSHCGWNSTLEALAGGVAVIGWPMFADQGINAQLLADHGMALVVEGTGMKPKRLVPAEEIAEFVEQLLNSPTYRNNAVKWSNIQKSVCEAGGSSQQDLNQLIMSL